jgi:hypothetical protein
LPWTCDPLPSLSWVLGFVCHNEYLSIRVRPTSLFLFIHYYLSTVIVIQC